MAWLECRKSRVGDVSVFVYRGKPSLISVGSSGNRDVPVSRLLEEGVANHNVLAKTLEK